VLGEHSAYGPVLVSDSDVEVPTHERLITWYFMDNFAPDDFVCNTGKEYLSKHIDGYEQNVSPQCTCHHTEIYMSFHAVNISNSVVIDMRYILFWDRNSCTLFVHTEEKRSKCHVKYYSNSFATRRLLLSGDVELNPGPCTALNSNLNETPTITANSNNIPSLAADLPSGLKFVSWNIQSLNAHLDQVRLTLNSPNEASVIGLSETWLNQNFMNKDIQIDGYRLAARLDRVSDTWGGVAMLVKENTPFDERIDLRHDNLEAIWIEITYPNSSPILVATIYRPPKSPVLWYEHFIDMCENAYCEGKEMIIMGDINIDFLKPNSIPKQWVDIMESYNLTQLIKAPTRVTNSSKTCIDHIYVTNPEHVRATKVATISISDHFPVCYSRSHNSATRKHKHSSIKYRSYKNFNQSAFLEDLTLVPWNVCESFDDPNDALDCWEKLFLEVVEKHAPLKERLVKKPKQPEWLTEEMLKAMNARDKFAQLNDDRNRKLWRNKANNLVRNGKTTYYKQLIESNIGNSKKLWNLIRDLAPQESKTTPTTLKDGDVILSNPQDICDSFNELFAQIGNVIAASLPNSRNETNDVLADFINRHFEVDSTFNIPGVSIDFVREELSKLDDAKSMGLDGISPKLLRLGATDRYSSFCYLDFKFVYYYFYVPR
jgi:hypothetical protein